MGTNINIDHPFLVCPSLTSLLPSAPPTHIHRRQLPCPFCLPPASNVILDTITILNCVDVIVILCPKNNFQSLL